MHHKNNFRRKKRLFLSIEGFLGYQGTCSGLWRSLQSRAPFRAQQGCEWESFPLNSKCSSGCFILLLMAGLLTVLKYAACNPIASAEFFQKTQK